MNPQPASAPGSALAVARVSRYGDRALLVELDSLSDVLSAYRRLQALRLPGVVDLVPAARTLVVLLDEEAPAASSTIADALRAGAATPTGDADSTRTVEIRVVYDGEDLPDVARALGVSADEVIRRHAGPEYIAAFSGFVPGFAYLVGLDRTLVVPRLASPRVQVPAGAVAIADRYTAVYPRVSPGGWRLIGRTDLTLFDPARQPPALITTGTRVRFSPVDP